MRRPRSISAPRLILALLLGLSLLAPEAVHSFVHHHAAEHHGDAQQDGGVSAAPHEPVAASDYQHGDDHPHLQLAAAPSTKLSLGQAMVAQAVLLAIQPLDAQRPLLPPAPPGVLPGAWDHGPPPPSRAPPLV